jgi:hypothetical protein
MELCAKEIEPAPKNVHRNKRMPRKTRVSQREHPEKIPKI